MHKINGFLLSEGKMNEVTSNIHKNRREFLCTLTLDI